LAAWFGGRAKNVYVPLVVSEDQVLAKLIGFSAAKKMSETWGGEHLALPRLTAYEEDLRRRIVGRMLEQNFSSREVAVHLRISERRVQQIARELEVAGLIDVVVPQQSQKKDRGKKEDAGIWSGLIRDTENDE
jgi:DNA-binding transcriptional regulator LsrR (DeoR family)